MLVVPSSLVFGHESSFNDCFLVYLIKRLHIFCFSVSVLLAAVHNNAHIFNFLTIYSMIGWDWRKRSWYDISGCTWQGIQFQPWLTCLFEESCLYKFHKFITTTFAFRELLYNGNITKNRDETYYTGMKNHLTDKGILCARHLTFRYTRICK